jgi:hypothetical protein
MVTEKLILKWEDGADLTDMTQDTDMQRALVITAMNFRLHYHAGNVFSRSESIRFSKSASWNRLHACLTVSILKNRPNYNTRKTENALTYGIKSSAPPKFRRWAGNVNILFVQLIQKPHRLCAPSPMRMSNTRCNPTTCRAVISEQEEYLETRERQMNVLQALLMNIRDSSPVLQAQWHKYEQPPFAT